LEAHYDVIIDFVMADSPFNVDLMDAGRIKSDPPAPFSLPGLAGGGRPARLTLFAERGTIPPSP
jgi:hypothetical protein